MEAFLSGVEWMPTIVSFVAAFGLGWLWYSPTLFQKGWLKGINISLDDNTPMLPAMIAQAVGTFLMAVIVGVAMAAGDIWMAVVVGLAMATIVKANGLFSKKSHYAIMVESGYILAMVLLMIIIQKVL